jgi:biopolymer transport protein ExbB
MAVRSRAQRWWQALIVGWVLVVMTLGALSKPGWAFQEEGAAAMPAEPAPAAPAAPADAAAATQATEGEKSYLMWMLEASGVFGALIGLLSFVMVAVIMMNLLQVRREVLLPPDFVAAFEEKFNAGETQAAFDLARGDDSFIARVLAAGLARVGRGYEDAVEGMQEVAEEESMAMEQRLSWLALIGSIAPMLGLLGTVQGMISSFRKIATSATQPKPKDLAEGISTALFTTLEGLVVAIPAIVAYTLLRNRVSSLLLEVGRVSDGFMSRFKRPVKAE